MFHVIEINTGESVAAYDDKRRAASHAASLNADAGARAAGYRFKVSKR
jgi:hypothetical protein